VCLFPKDAELAASELGSALRVGMRS